MHKIDVDSGKCSYDAIPDTAAGGVRTFKIDLDTTGMPAGEVLTIVTLTTNSPLRPIVNLFIAGYIE